MYLPLEKPAILIYVVLLSWIVTCPSMCGRSGLLVVHPHSANHAVSLPCSPPALQLTSWLRRGSIMGASSVLGQWAGDEDSLFSHSVIPGALLPVSRKERFSSLMLLWCFTSSSGGSVS